MGFGIQTSSVAAGGNAVPPDPNVVNSVKNIMVRVGQVVQLYLQLGKLEQVGEGMKQQEL